MPLANAAQAQTPAPAADAKPADAKPAEPNSVTGSFGIYSQYIFRGLSQTDEKPAFQGGFDFAPTNGIDLGNIGAYCSDSNTKDAGYAIAGRNIRNATGTVFIQNTFCPSCQLECGSLT